MRALLYDCLRLFIGPWVAAPRGIDRIDFAYAEHLMAAWPGEAFGVMPTPWGVRLYPRELVLRGLGRLAEIWREDADYDPVFEWVVGRLRGVETGLERAPRGESAVARQWRMVRATGLPFGRSVRKAPGGALYLNVGQLGWAAPWSMGWLAKRADIGVVLMLHDAIPIEHPELVSRSGAAAHRQMMRVASRHIDGLITSTKAAHDAVLRVLAERGAVPRACLSLPLPLAPGFEGGGAVEEGLRGLNYFLVCGAVEPRKNLGMLMGVWRELVARMGNAAPRLVVVGSQGLGAEGVVREMAGLSPFVIHAAGVSTAGLRRLMRSARALLMPSLAEGFGLPVQEALALKTGVVASDLPAHREVSGGLARLLPPDRADLWLESVLSPPAGGDYHPMPAMRYFDAVSEWLWRL